MAHSEHRRVAPLGRPDPSPSLAHFPLPSALRHSRKAPTACWWSPKAPTHSSTAGLGSLQSSDEA
jgi:hypothetical protein